MRIERKRTSTTCGAVAAVEAVKKQRLVRHSACLEDVLVARDVCAIVVQFLDFPDRRSLSSVFSVLVASPVRRAFVESAKVTVRLPQDGNIFSTDEALNSILGPSSDPAFQRPHSRPRGHVGPLQAAADA